MSAEDTSTNLENQSGQAQGLPPADPDLNGSTHHIDHNYKLSVSNANGYLCHIKLESNWPVPPETIFAINTFPNNTALFRDMKQLGARKVISSKPGLKVVDVEQVGELKVLWMKRHYSTYMRVTEDMREEDNLRIKFDLQKSDVLAKFSGNWSFTPVKDAATGEIIGCNGVLEQDVLPNGIPPFLQRVPVLGGLLRGLSVRAIRRVMDDLNEAVSKVAKGQAAGKTVHQVLTDLCGKFEGEEGFANGTVSSFAIDDDTDGEEEQDETEKEDDEIEKEKLGRRVEEQAEEATGGPGAAATQPSAGGQ